jgi:hypothetical protein
VLRENAVSFVRFSCAASLVKLGHPHRTLVLGGAGEQQLARDNRNIDAASLVFNSGLGMRVPVCWVTRNCFGRQSGNGITGLNGVRTANVVGSPTAVETGDISGAPLARSAKHRVYPP